MGRSRSRARRPPENRDHAREANRDGGKGYQSSGSRGSGWTGNDKNREYDRGREPDRGGGRSDGGRSDGARADAGPRSGGNTDPALAVATWRREKDRREEAERVLEEQARARRQAEDERILLARIDAGVSSALRSAGVQPQAPPTDGVQAAGGPTGGIVNGGMQPGPSNGSSSGGTALGLGSNSGGWLPMLSGSLAVSDSHILFWAKISWTFGANTN